eukprot:CAMPEP_0185843650 /NCGR_PEP_ID=MMETSP1354-20130828/80_1 /TAXON_ID=708628 /ORGANISM="Erythrolobus madagascarensis, Strain CCMP3276" /LENGTH=173 /DNA_ID=CAMNT_0028543175 /DNA_START=142 /DNA_END=663 /DNA_ORIENTATION=-
MKIAMVLVASALSVLVILELTGRSMLPTLVKTDLFEHSSGSLAGSMKMAVEESESALITVAKAIGIVFVAAFGMLVGVTTVMTVIKAAEMDFEFDVEDQKESVSFVRRIAAIEPAVAKQVFADTMVDNVQVILLFLTYAMMTMHRVTHPVGTLLDQPRETKADQGPLLPEYTV